MKRIDSGLLVPLGDIYTKFSQRTHIELEAEFWDGLFDVLFICLDTQIASSMYQNLLEGRDYE